MTRQATKKKRDKKRAEKRKHEHRTEQMAEEAAEKKWHHREEVVAIIVMLVFVPFMVGGIIWWPASTAKGEITLPDGTYTAAYLGSRPATESDVAVAALDVNGESVFVNEHDLSGGAAKRSSAFFEGQRGEPIEITVNNGFVTDWMTAAPGK